MQIKALPPVFNHLGSNRPRVGWRRLVHFFAAWSNHPYGCAIAVQRSLDARNRARPARR